MISLATGSGPGPRPFFDDDTESIDIKSIKSKAEDDGYSDNEETPLFTFDPESDSGISQIPRIEPALALNPAWVAEQGTVIVMKKSWKQWSGVSGLSVVIGTVFLIRVYRREIQPFSTNPATFCIAATARSASARPRVG